MVDRKDTGFPQEGRRHLLPMWPTTGRSKHPSAAAAAAAACLHVGGRVLLADCVDEGVLLLQREASHLKPRVEPSTGVGRASSWRLGARGQMLHWAHVQPTKAAGMCVHNH